MRLIWIIISLIFIGIVGLDIPQLSASKDLVEISNFRITDLSGNKLDKVITGEKTLVQVDLTNLLDVPQKFVYNITYENQDGVKNTFPHWIEGNLPASFTFPIGSLVDFPFSGEYRVTVEIWNNRYDKTLIAPVVSHFVIVEGDAPASIIQKSVDAIDNQKINMQFPPILSSIVVIVSYGIPLVGILLLFFLPFIIRDIRNRNKP